MIINHSARTISLTKKEMTAARHVDSVEYKKLQIARRDYSGFAVVTVSRKVKTQRETYKGLTYTYMENYIQTHEGADTVEAVMAEYWELRLVSECHGKARRYPAIKKWFLKKYPAIEQFGKELEDQIEGNASNYEVVMPPLVSWYEYRT